MMERRNAGFTLLEIMLVVGVMVILFFLLYAGKGRSIEERCSQDVRVITSEMERNLRSGVVQCERNGVITGLPVAVSSWGGAYTGSCLARGVEISVNIPAGKGDCAKLVVMAIPLGSCYISGSVLKCYMMEKLRVMEGKDWF